MWTMDSLVAKTKTEMSNLRRYGQKMAHKLNVGLR